MGKRARSGTKHKTIGKPSSNAKHVIKRRQHSQNQRPKHGSLLNQVKADPLQRPLKVPFGRHDNVLLVGEGDFSFALSLLQHCKPFCITATCFDGETELIQKYPRVKETIQKIIGNSCEALEKKTNSTPLNGQVDNIDHEIWRGFSPNSLSAASEDESDDIEAQAEKHSKCKVFYGVDATKLSTVHRKTLRPLAPFSKIVFNFPHVGGLSTDVNRQVRANQQLLVGFFEAAKPLLSNPERPATRKADEWKACEQFDEETVIDKGQILVTLFEGSPYTLWNIRDLARHCGLQVVESFKFPWHAYPGYQHARTIGDIITGKDRAAEGKRKGAWRGEERDARSFVMECKDDTDGGLGSSQARNRSCSDQDSEDDGG